MENSVGRNLRPTEFFFNSVIAASEPQSALIVLHYTNRLVEIKVKGRLRVKPAMTDKCGVLGVFSPHPQRKIRHCMPALQTPHHRLALCQHKFVYGNL